MSTFTPEATAVRENLTVSVLRVRVQIYPVVGGGGERLPVFQPTFSPR